VREAAKAGKDVEVSDGLARTEPEVLPVVPALGMRERQG
jgi:hypothetical protein